MLIASQRPHFQTHRHIKLEIRLPTHCIGEHNQAKSIDGQLISMYAQTLLSIQYLFSLEESEHHSGAYFLCDTLHLRQWELIHRDDSFA